MRGAVLRCLAVLLLAVALAAAGAQPRVPGFSGLVVDEVGVLGDEAETALLRRLGKFQNTDRAQAAILVARGTEGLALADFSLLVAQTWKLGHAGRDDGMLILIVPSLNAARIEVGYGLEGSVPDVKAARWIDELLLPAIRERQFAQGLHAVLDQLDAALPAPPAPKPQEPHILDQHPEWGLPFVLVVFSPFSVFPLFLSRWGALISGPAFATFMGLAAWWMWGSRPIAIAIAAVAFVLPFLWCLNLEGKRPLRRWQQVAKDIGNAFGVAFFFCVLMLFLGIGLWDVPEAKWGAPLFAGTMSLGLAVFFFPSLARAWFFAASCTSTSS